MKSFIEFVNESKSLEALRDDELQDMLRDLVATRSRQHMLSPKFAKNLASSIKDVEEELKKRKTK